jgi:hypothetical protein
LFGLFLSRREARRSVDETTRQLVKWIDVEPPPDSGPIEELACTVGEAGPRSWADARPGQKFARRARQTVEDRE